MPESDDQDGQTVFFRPRREPASPEVPDLAHYMVVTNGDEAVARVEVGATPLTIGREAGQAVVVADTGVSRRHARIVFDAGELIVEDLGSTNGTFVNGQRLSGPTTLAPGSVVRVGTHRLQYERRSRREVTRGEALERELRKATSYVMSLLPPPTDGPIPVDWRFVPSTQLGGDAFGYYWLDPDTFVFYLLDVSGHGAGSAMHSVTVLNVLRQQALPRVDFARPDEVLRSLNDRFQMASHGGLFFTIWYGVYRPSSRHLRYASAGHHAAYLVADNRRTHESLCTPALMIGVNPGNEYESADVTVPPDSRLYVFSDGLFEIVSASGERWSLTEFEPLLLEPAISGTPESERLYQAVRGAAAPGPLDDDVSLMVLTFR